MSDRPRAHLLAWALAAVLLVVAAVKLAGGGSGEPAAAPVRVERPAGRGAEAERGGAYVHVAGAVRRPGLYRLDSGDRVAEAIRRAGGPLRHADLTAVNLAARVEDGRQILVPRAGAGASAAPGAAAAAGSHVSISLSTATAEQLDGLDGIGPTLAKRIVEYRQAHGGFGSVSELRQVEGIGPKRFEALSKALQP